MTMILFTHVQVYVSLQILRLSLDHFSPAPVRHDFVFVQKNCVSDIELHSRAALRHPVPQDLHRAGCLTGLSA